MRVIGGVNEMASKLNLDANTGDGAIGAAPTQSPTKAWMCFAFTMSPPENGFGDVQGNERHSRRPVPPYLFIAPRPLA